MPIKKGSKPKMLNQTQFANSNSKNNKESKMNTYTAKVVIECNGSVIEQEMFYSTDLAELKSLAQCNLGNGKEDILVPDLKCAVRVLKAWMAGQIKLFDSIAQRPVQKQEFEQLQF